MALSACRPSAPPEGDSPPPEGSAAAAERGLPEGDSRLPEGSASAAEQGLPERNSALPQGNALPDGAVAVQGELRLTVDDVETAIAWRELRSGTSIADALGADWADDDRTLGRLVGTLLDEALLTSDCAAFGVEATEPDIETAIAAEPTIAAFAALPREQRNARLAALGLTWNDVRWAMGRDARYAGWVERRVADVTDDDLWNAWRGSHDRARLTAVLIPNTFSRAEVDAFLASDTPRIEQWYTEHLNYFMRPADENGDRELRPLDEVLRREIAQRMLRELGAAVGAMERASAARAAVEAGALDGDAELPDALRAVDTGLFRRTSSANIPTLGQAPALVEAVFEPDVAAGDIVGPVRTFAGLVVARVEERQLPTRGEFEAGRDEFEVQFDEFMRRSAWPARIEEYGERHERRIDLDALRRGLADHDVSTDTGRTQ